jgi:CheY-like chemotaxis protein
MFPPETVVLVVDDSNVVRESVRKELTAIGLKNIVEAEDGKKASILLEAAAKSPSPIGLIICDWNMPVMTGIDFLKFVRFDSKWTNLPFIMLTSVSQIAEVVDAISAGVSTYMVKPLDDKSLKEKLAAVWLKHNPAK